MKNYLSYIPMIGRFVDITKEMICDETSLEGPKKLDTKLNRELTKVHKQLGILTERLTAPIDLTQVKGKRRLEVYLRYLPE